MYVCHRSKVQFCTAL